MLTVPALAISSLTAAPSEAEFFGSSDLSTSFECDLPSISFSDVEPNLQFLKEKGIDGIKDPSTLEGPALLRELGAILSGPAQMYADDQTENGLTQSSSDNEIGDGRAQSHSNDQVRDVPTQLQSRSHKGTNQSDLIDDEMSKEPAVQWSSEGGHFMGTAPIQGSLEPWHGPMNAAKVESYSGKRASLNHVENPTSQQGGKSPQNMQAVAFQTDYVGIRLPVFYLIVFINRLIRSIRPPRSVSARSRRVKLPQRMSTVIHMSPQRYFPFFLLSS
ncbi:hypothetical protein FRC20_010020 [Serendipita sp. 405]|nr:hypothetical protein FRC20_010020 [Serendipita sp. 405]